MLFFERSVRCVTAQNRVIFARNLMNSQTYRIVSVRFNWQPSNGLKFNRQKCKGWRMVKSETRRDAEILVRNPSPRLFGKKFRDSKKVNTNHAKTILRDLSKTLPRFRDPAKIFRDPRFSRYHSPPLMQININRQKVLRYLKLHFFGRSS